MRVLAEIDKNTNRIFVRFVGTTGNPTFSIPPTEVLVGSYIIDGTPRIPSVITIAITATQIVEKQTNFYLSGYFPLPERLVVTLPDLTQQVVKVVQVVKRVQSLLAQQPDDILTPDEPPAHVPATAHYRPSLQSPLEIPDIWVTIDLTRALAVIHEGNMLSDEITYSGGGQGRALSATERQQAEDAIPWLVGSPVKVEGTYTNVLQRSTFEPTRFVDGFFDLIPEEWDIIVADPNSLLRVTPSANGLSLPSMTLTYHQNPQGDFLTVPPVIVLTPNVPAYHSFQILVDPGIDNAVGNIILESPTGVIATTPVFFCCDAWHFRVICSVVQFPILGICSVQQANPTSYFLVAVPTGFHKLLRENKCCRPAATPVRQVYIL